MKDVLNTLAVLLCTAIVILSLPVLMTTTREYMTVSAVQRQSGYVELVDDKGNLWSFTGYGFSKGERVIVDMYNNDTPNDIYDDQIVSVKKLQ